MRVYQQLLSFVVAALMIAGCADLSGSAGSGLSYGEPYSAQNDGSRDVESYGFGGDLGGAAGADSEIYDDADAMLELINNARCAEGLAPLSVNPVLMQAAVAHSQDMIARGYADHTTPDGAEPGDRISAAGYEWSSVGENLALGAADVQAVFDGWIASEGHRNNLLNGVYHEMGLGHVSAEGTEWTHYWTLVLAAPAEGDATPAESCDSY